MTDWNTIYHFRPEEFDSPDEPGSGQENMDASFMRKLDDARMVARVAFKINSGYRSAAHNAIVGGKRGSAHRKGMAADIAWTRFTRDRILRALIQCDFVRIGMAPTFVHVDVATGPAYPARFWMYGPNGEIV